MFGGDREDKHTEDIVTKHTPAYLLINKLLHFQLLFVIFIMKSIKHF